MNSTDLPTLPTWDEPPEDLPTAIAAAKSAIIARIEAGGRTVADALDDIDDFIEGELAEIDRDHRDNGSAWPEVAFADVESGTATHDLVEQIHRRGCVVVRGHFPAAQAHAWDRGIEDYATVNGFFESYEGPGDDFFGSVSSRPTIYPIYWSRSQMEARQSPRMAIVQRFLNRLWHSEAGQRSGFDADRNIIYPDRIRRRPPGTTSDGLGAHIDSGNVDLWLNATFQASFERVFAGAPLDHDPWNGADRSDTSKFPGSTMCSVFRTFQGWTALSFMQQDQGVLEAVPIPLAITRLLLRPLLDDVAPAELCGVTPNRVFPVTTDWHRRLLDGLSPVPDIQPGDSVWWHPDLIHAVAPVTHQEGWASIMYIPAAPWNPRNARYAEAVRDAFLSGSSPSDFPSEHYEATWTDRFGPMELNELGRSGLAM